MNVVRYPTRKGCDVKRRDCHSPPPAVFSGSPRENERISLVSCTLATISPTIGLETATGSARIQVTHSPYLSRFAVTYIKGEFFYCALPVRRSAVFGREERS